MTDNTSPDNGLGPATNRHNSPVRDPSVNVSDLVEATSLRLTELLQAETEHARHASKSLRRELLVRIEGIQNEMRLRSDYETRLSAGESDRLDSIRANDVAQSTADKVVTETRASALAATTSQSAEALRNQVTEASTAKTLELDGVVGPIKTEIAQIRELQYRQQGERAERIEARDVNRDAVAEMAPVLLAIEKLTLAQAVATGGHAQVVDSRAKSGSVAMWIGLGIAALGLALSAAVALSTLVLGIVGVVITLLLR